MSKMKIPCHDGLVYLARLRIIQTPWFGVYWHNIYQPDGDRHPHDHPWNFSSFIVRGGYTEVVHPLPWLDLKMNRYTRRWERFTWHKMTTDQAHRIISLDPGTISLIFVGKRSRNWGFFTEDGWMTWQDYEKAMKKSA